MNKIFFISNNYRKTRISGFIKANCFGDFKLMSDIIPEYQKLWFIRKFYYNIKLLLSDIIIVSDIDGINYLQNFHGLKNKHINLLMWNSEKELEEINIQKLKSDYIHLKVFFFFKESVKRAKELYQIDARYLISPLFPYVRKSPVIINRIIYCSEIDIFSQLSESSVVLDSKIWDYANRVLNEGSHLLYKAELISLFFKDFIYDFDMLWVLKNRIRYLYAQKLKETYQERFVLIGNDWINLGFDALPSNYDSEYLYDIYSTSKICIDLLSKSSNEALFERVMQVIAVSDGILQLKTIDSEEVYEKHVNERTFDTYSNLEYKINHIFSLSQEEFKNQGNIFRTFIKQKCVSFIN